MHGDAGFFRREPESSRLVPLHLDRKQCVCWGGGGSVKCELPEKYSLINAAE